MSECAWPSNGTRTFASARACVQPVVQCVCAEDRGELLHFRLAHTAHSTHTHTHTHTHTGHGQDQHDKKVRASKQAECVRE